MKINVEQERHIHHLYVETNGERIRLFKSLIAGRAFAQHYNNGGLITDDIGQHIHELIKKHMTYKNL